MDKIEPYATQIDADACHKLGQASPCHGRYVFWYCLGSTVVETPQGYLKNMDFELQPWRDVDLQFNLEGSELKGRNPS